MSASEVVKRNISGMRVIKTLQLLLENNYTMGELIENLNKKEKEPIFNNSVVSKYINTCRYCGIEIPKIHNRYFVANLPFGLDLSFKDIDLLNRLEMVAEQKLANKSKQVFNSFLTRLNKFSNKSITRVEEGTMQEAFDTFEKAINEKRYIRLMFRAKAVMDCIPLDIIEYRGKRGLKVFHENKEKKVSINRISGMEVLGKISPVEESNGQKVLFKLTGGLAIRYNLRDHEEIVMQKLPEYITVSNVGENKKELLSRLLRYGEYCEIMSPKSYREEMKQILKSMLENYGE